MAKLTETNSSIDKNSGAVMFHKSPELNEIIRIRKEIQELNQKIDIILNLLKEGHKDG